MFCSELCLCGSCVYPVSVCVCVWGSSSIHGKCSSQLGPHFSNCFPYATNRVATNRVSTSVDRKEMNVFFGMRHMWHGKGLVAMGMVLPVESFHTHTHHGTGRHCNKSQQEQIERLKKEGGKSKEVALFLLYLNIVLLTLFAVSFPVF